MAISHVIEAEDVRKSVIVEHFARFLLASYPNSQDAVVEFNFRDSNWRDRYKEAGASIFDMMLAEDWVSVHSDLGHASILLDIDPTRPE